MKLTKNQISELYAFTEKKYVEFYDVQTEIVDHLASAIEDKLENKEASNFEDALSQVYAGFGIFGFSDLVSEKSDLVIKTQFKRFLGCLAQCFAWPRILISALVFGLIYLTITVSFKSITEEWVDIIFVGLAITLLAYTIVFLIIQNRKKPKHKLVSINSLFIYTSIFGSLINLLYIGFNSFKISHNAVGMSLIVFIAFLYVWSVNSLYKFVYEEQKYLYPELFK